MKKIKVSLYFLLVLTLTISMPTFTVSSSASNPETEWKKFLQSYVASVSIGALNGLVVDEMAKYIWEKVVTNEEGQHSTYLLETFPSPVRFFISLFIKIAILSNIKRDMGKYSIPHKSSLMFLTTSLTPFREFLKDHCSNLFEGDFCKQLLSCAKSCVKFSFLKLLNFFSNLQRQIQ